MVNNVDYQTGVSNAYGQNANLINESGNNLFGANTPTEVGDKVRQSRLFRNTTDKGKAMFEAKQGEDQAKLGGYMSLGSATAPRFVQTGGTSTITQPTDWSGMGEVLGGSTGKAIAM